MNHRTGGEAPGGELPKLFHAGGIDLRFFPGIEPEFGDRLFCERSAHALTEDDDLRIDIRAGLVIRFVRAVMRDAFIAGTNADDAVALPE